jgi:bacterioferritin-associated ferredoxin
MIICHCVGVTERRIRLIALSGGCTRERVAEMCGAGTCCGGCQPAIDEIIEQEQPGSCIEFQATSSRLQESA